MLRNIKAFGENRRLRVFHQWNDADNRNVICVIFVINDVNNYKV